MYIRIKSEKIMFRNSSNNIKDSFNKGITKVFKQCKTSYLIYYKIAIFIFNIKLK